MTAPSFSALARDPAGRRRQGVVFILLFVFLFWAPVRAQGLGDPYSATVKLDATAVNAVKAREKARQEGERRALEKVIDGLAGASGASALSSLDDRSIAAMIVRYSVADERMSSRRYRASYTYHFDPQAVKAVLQSAGLSPVSPAAASAGGRASAASAVVLPVYRGRGRLVLWDDPNRWRDAWGRLSLSGEPLRLVVPLGGIADLGAVDAGKAVAGDRSALSAIARRYGTRDTIVALARAERSENGLSALSVSLKRYREGELAGTSRERFAAQTGEREGEVLQRAARASLALIEGAGAGGVAAEGGGREGAEGGSALSSAGGASSLEAVVFLSRLGDWVELRGRLQRLASVRGVELLSLRRHEARIRIDFVGSERPLDASLAAWGLRLAGGGPVKRIERSGAFR